MKKQFSTILLCLSTMAGMTTFAQDIGITKILEATNDNIATTNNILPNNIAFEIIKQHIYLAHLPKTINPEEEWLATLKEVEELSKTDIVQALTLAADRQSTLSTYLTQVQKALEKWSLLISFYRQELALLQLDMRWCMVDKSLADKLYFESINQYDQESSTQAINQSVKSDSCISENRIQYNAKMYILNKLVFFTSILQKKYELLFNEQEVLIKHFDVLSDTMIKKLQIINETLKNYQF